MSAWHRIELRLLMITIIIWVDPYNPITSITSTHLLIHDFLRWFSQQRHVPIWRLQETSRLFSLDLSAFCNAVAKVDTTREMAVAYAKECVTGRYRADVDVCEKNDGFCYVFFWGLGYELVIVRLWFPSDPFLFFYYIWFWHFEYDFNIFDFTIFTIFDYLLYVIIYYFFTIIFTIFPGWTMF